eukprot:scaffold113826_cov55-Phaeocystis_antarctica.AAC.3
MLADPRCSSWWGARPGLAPAAAPPRPSASPGEGEGSVVKRPGQRSHRDDPTQQQPWVRVRVRVRVRLRVRASVRVRVRVRVRVGVRVSCYVEAAELTQLEQPPRQHACWRRREGTLAPLPLRAALHEAARQ